MRIIWKGNFVLEYGVSIFMGYKEKKWLCIRNESLLLMNEKGEISIKTFSSIIYIQHDIS